MVRPSETLVEPTTGPLPPSGAQPHLVASSVKYTRLRYREPLPKQVKRQHLTRRPRVTHTLYAPARSDAFPSIPVASRMRRPFLAGRPSNLFLGSRHAGLSDAYATASFLRFTAGRQRPATRPLRRFPTLTVLTLVAMSVPLLTVVGMAIANAPRPSTLFPSNAVASAIAVLSSLHVGCPIIFAVSTMSLPEESYAISTLPSSGAGSVTLLQSIAVLNAMSLTRVATRDAHSLLPSTVAPRASVVIAVLSIVLLHTWKLPHRVLPRHMLFRQYGCFTKPQGAVFSRSGPTDTSSAVILMLLRNSLFAFLVR